MSFQPDQRAKSTGHYNLYVTRAGWCPAAIVSSVDKHRHECRARHGEGVPALERPGAAGGAVAVRLLLPVLTGHEPANEDAGDDVRVARRVLAGRRAERVHAGESRAAVDGAARVGAAGGGEAAAAGREPGGDAAARRGLRAARAAAADGAAPEQHVAGLRESAGGELAHVRRWV
ncbi:unnamed protein product [Phytophthora lilii]|uniref:Unnamed protein product n=1 Tax=Phytophthora lilii TaxID=2077276 RepID=A0A9W6TU23_9STRA|nr:unnamed protein product [Phytophthora lilii]